jgi:hypothetical protein
LRQTEFLNKKAPCGALRDVHHRHGHRRPRLYRAIILKRIREVATLLNDQRLIGSSFCEG